jgi:bacteriorhodopsin
LTLAFVVASWSLFPVIWILAHIGFGLSTTFIEAVLYLALDFLTKIAFRLYIATRENPSSGPLFFINVMSANSHRKIFPNFFYLARAFSSSQKL